VLVDNRFGRRHRGRRTPEVSAGGRAVAALERGRGRP
jgi:hypothetical protein